MSEEQLQQAAEDYLQAVENQPEDSELERFREKKENLEKQKEDIDLDEDHPIFQDLVNEIEDLQGEIEGRRDSVEDVESQREEFLTLVTNQFIAEENFLNPAIIEALTHSLLGERREEFSYDTTTVTPDAELDEDKREVSYAIVKLAEDRLGDGDMEEMWESFSTSKKYPPFRMVAEAAEPLHPKEVAENLNEEKEVVRNLMKNPRYQQKFNPYGVEDGSYSLSIVGEYLWRNYGEGEPHAEEDDGQQTLNSEAIE